MEKRILAIGAGIGAASSAVSASAIVLAQQYGGIGWLVPVAVVAALANAAISGFMFAYRANA